MPLKHRIYDDFKWEKIQILYIFIKVACGLWIYDDLFVVICSLR